MANTVNIRVSGLHRDVSAEPTVVEYSGSFHSDTKQHYIRYTDPDGIKNMIKLASGRATVTRSGALSSIMEFVEGQRTECVYPTPYGNFDTVIETSAVQILGSDMPATDPAHDAAKDAGAVSDAAPFARILYDLTMNGQKISGCELTIYISKT